VKFSGIAAWCVCVSAASALACGVCLEDKVAAAYDHAIVASALKRERVVVFAELSGSMTPESLAKAARRAVGTVPGVEAGTVRAATAPAALSFVVDPRVVAPEAALARAQVAAGPAVRMGLLKVLR
jgi:hypothetical protein